MIRFLAPLCLMSLAACGGTSSNYPDLSSIEKPVFQSDVLRTEGARLARFAEGLDPTTSAALLPVGGATYEGVMALIVPSESGGTDHDRIDGSLVLEMNFAGGSFTGQADKFFADPDADSIFAVVDRAGGARQGSLEISNGSILRLDSEVLLLGDFSGEVDLYAGPRPLSGGLVGAFGGEDGVAASGGLSGSFTLGNDPGQNDENEIPYYGAFVTERTVQR